MEARIINMLALIEDVDHPNAERARELLELKKLALYELLKEKEQRIIQRSQRAPGRQIKKIEMYGLEEELQDLIKTLGDLT